MYIAHVITVGDDADYHLDSIWLRIDDAKKRYTELKDTAPQVYGATYPAIMYQWPIDKIIPNNLEFLVDNKIMRQYWDGENDLTVS